MLLLKVLARAYIEGMYENALGSLWNLASADLVASVRDLGFCSPVSTLSLNFPPEGLKSQVTECHPNSTLP